MLREDFINIIERNNGTEKQALQLWAEIEKRYSSTKRVYHTLRHLDNMYSELLPVRNSIQNWDALIIAIAYHDSVYEPLRRDNEEQSALLAEKRLSGLCDDALIRKTKELIHITKFHFHDSIDDLAYLVDADLSIFGKSEKTYEEYTVAIRKEYSIYPDNIYNAARKNILLKFLQNARFYITPHFHNLYEEQARKNVSREILQLG